MARKHFATIKVMLNGRLTIPSDIRELEHIRRGNYVRVSIEKIEESVDGNGEESIPKQRRYAKSSHRQEVTSDD